MRVDEGHDDWGDGAKEGGAEDDIVGAKAVNKEAGGNADDNADEDVGEEAEGGLNGGEALS